MAAHVPSRPFHRTAQSSSYSLLWCSNAETSLYLEHKNFDGSAGPAIASGNTRLIREFTTEYRSPKVLRVVASGWVW